MSQLQGRSAAGLAIIGLVVALLTGCGAAKKARGGPGIVDVFAVKMGMTSHQVRKLAGRPTTVSSSSASGRCWLYHVDRVGISIHVVRICFANGHVSVIDTPSKN